MADFLEAFVEKHLFCLVIVMVKVVVRTCTLMMKVSKKCNVQWDSIINDYAMHLGEH